MEKQTQGFERCLKKKKGKTNNNMIRGDLWDEARGDTIPRKKKCARDGTGVIIKS